MARGFKVKLTAEHLPWLAPAAALAAFVWALPGKLFWDSEVLISQNAFLRSFDHLPKLWTTSVMAGAGVPTNFYRPVSTTVLLFCYQLWGLSPMGYHLVNVLLHALNAYLVFRLVEDLTERDVKLAACVALLFAIHPVQSEQVNYPDHIEGLLAMTFGLGAVLSWLRGGGAWTTAGFYALSILSKEEGLVFGPIMGMLWLRRRARSGFEGWKELAPAAAAAVVYVVLRLTVFNFLDLPVSRFGAQRGDAYASLPLRLLTFPKALMLYLRLLVAPYGLHFDRALPPATWGDWRAWLSLAACGGVFGTLWKRGGQREREGLLWFFIALLPFSGLVPFNNIAAEHFLYIPIVGLLLAVLPHVLRAAERVEWERLRWAAAALALACLALNARRSLQWQNPETIYRSTLAHNKGSFRAATNLGVERFRAGDIDGAQKFFRRALLVKGDYPVALNNMGAVTEARGDLDRAERLYRQAIDLEPDYLLARKNLAGIFIAKKKYDDAVSHLNDTLAKNHDFDAAWKSLGMALFLKGDLPRAQAAMRRGLELNADEATLQRLAAIEDALAQGELEHRKRRDVERQLNGGLGGLPPGGRP